MSRSEGAAARHVLAGLLFTDLTSDAQSGAEMVDMTAVPMFMGSEL